MRCKKHLSDRSSSVGVCASCLRERLFTLVESQARAQALAEEDRRKSDPHPPPPLIFPRSVSPYICRRSDDSSWHHHRLNDNRFYSTPQVGPTTTSTTTTATVNTAPQKKKKYSSKFNLISNFFRSSSRSNEPEPEPVPVPIPDPRLSTISRASLSTSTSSPISSTWFSSFIPSRRKKRSPSPSTTTRRPCRTRDRGMSPSCEENEDYDCKDAGSPSATSGYLSESSPGWRKSAAAAQQSRRRGQSQINRSVSGMAFCLSPLVRASPKSHRSQKDCQPGTMGYSGEIGWVSNNKPNLSTAASFCANRSRKLANFGRYNYNP